MLRMAKLPGTIPHNSSELIELLDKAVPRVAMRPGADVEETIYQQGARDLVDILVNRQMNPQKEEPANPGTAPRDNGYMDEYVGAQDYIDALFSDW